MSVANKRTFKTSRMQTRSKMLISSKPNKLLDTIIKLLQENGHRHNYCIYYDDKNNEAKIKKFKILKQLGEHKISGHGKVFLLNYNNIQLAVKIFAYEINDVITEQAATEIAVLKKIQSLTDNIFHMPYIYVIEECPLVLDANSITRLKTNFPYIEDVIKYHYQLIFTDIADGSLSDFIKTQYKIVSGWNVVNSIVQIIFSLYFFHKNTGYLHNDLHWGNMLYTKKNIDIKYSINNNIYSYVNKAENNYLWTIWDFDTCTPMTEQSNYKHDYFKVLSNFNQQTMHIENALSRDGGLKQNIEVADIYYICIKNLMSNSKTEDAFIDEFLKFLVDYKILQETSI
jgi:hypothetical protein